MSTEEISRVRRTGRWFWVLSVVLFLIGIGGLGTASSNQVTLFGVTMDAKFAYFIYFVLGAACLWSLQEARKRGIRD